MNIHLETYVCIYTLCMCIYIYIYIYTHIHTHKYAFACTNIHIHIYMCIRYSHVHIYIYIYIYIYIGCLLGFECDCLLSFAIHFSSTSSFFLSCMHPHTTFQACQISANFTTDWALLAVLAHMNIIMWSSRLDMFVHMAFKTSK